MIVYVPTLIEGKILPNSWFLAEIDDNFVYRNVGLNEEKSALEEKYSVVLIDARFQLLFDIGINAFASGFLRDAVVSFSAALERFYQFYIFCYFSHHNIDEKTHKKFWSLVSKQSERQYGAFVALSALSNHEFPQLLSSDDVGFRNKVVHQGIFPDKSKSYEFCLSVLKVITSNIEVMNNSFGASTAKALSKELSERNREACTYELSINPFLKLESMEFDQWKLRLDGHIYNIEKISYKGIVWPNSW